MKKITKIIIFVIVVILILSITIILMRQINKDANKEENGIEKEIDGNNLNDEETEPLSEEDYQLKNVTNREDYLIAKEILQSLLGNINNLDYNLNGSRTEFNDDNEKQQFLDDYKSEAIKTIKNLMPEDYIKEYQINNKIIENKLSKYANKNLIINKMYECNKNENLKLFFIYSSALETNDELDFVIIVDTTNKTYNLMLDDYIQKNNINDDMLGKIPNFEFNDFKNIKVNDSNQYDDPNSTDEAYSRELISDYKNILLNNKEKAYNMLDEDYKNKRFNNNFENFKKFVDNNQSDIEEIDLNKYEISIKDNYTEYICVDQYDDYIIFRENNSNIVDYKAILDVYTIDIEEITQKYNYGDDQTKIAVNVGKIMDALNKKDYEYVYSKLNGTFRQNKFNNISIFENYINNKIFEKSIIDTGDLTQNGDTYIYEMTLKDANNEDEEEKTLYLIIRLLDNNDFEISFGE